MLDMPSARSRLTAPWMALVAGSVDSAAFSITGRSASHMSGQTVITMSRVADGRDHWAVTSGVVVAGFVAGATVCGFVIACRGDRPKAQVLGPLLAAEAATVGLAGCVLLSGAEGGFAETMAMLVIAFSMGLQNEASSRLLGDRVRTTHVTGVSTDIGDGLGRLAFDALRLRGRPRVGDAGRLARSASLLAGFALGALGGAELFLWFGVGCVLVLSLLPAVAAAAHSGVGGRR